MLLADLHTHTTCSDGRLSPPGLVEKAALRGIGVLAVTDHDSVAGLALAAFAARQRGIRLLPGVELSADVDGRDLHLLGYGFDPSDETLRAHLEAYREDRLERARAMTARLAELGAPVEFGEVLRLAGGGAVGRPHVARALMEAGHVATVGQAFEHYLRDGGPAFVPKVPVPPADLIEMVHGAGGVVVLAHPSDVVDEAAALRLLDVGLDGVEVIHPSHSAPIQEHWEAFVARHSLLATGGSDYHGFRPGDEDAFGTVGIAMDRIETLLANAVA